MEKKPRGKYNVPGKGSKKGCLCRDNTYSTKCCKDDDYVAQGIGFAGGKG
jgi:hypothetical protein